MAGPWDTPPTEDEVASTFAAPPTPDEIAAGEAPEEEAPAPAPEAPGYAEAVARGVGQGGTLGFADEIVGLFRALRPGYADAEDGPVTQEAPAGATFGERYRSGRDEERAANKAAQEANPKTSFAANLLGGGAVAAGLPAFLAAKGATLPAKIASGAASAAPVGAAYGLGGSESETLGGQAADTFIGGLGGALVGGAMPIAGAALRGVAGPAADWLKKTAINQGRKVLTGNSGTISVKKPLSEGAVQSALDEGAIRPFGTTQGAAERLSQSREAVGDIYGDLVAALEAKGVTGPDAAALAQRLAAEGQAVANRSLGSPAPGMYRDVAEELAGKVAPPQSRLGLTQAEDMKRTLQRAAQSEYVKEGRQSLGGEAKVDIARALREAIESEVQAQAPKAPAEAAAFEPVKRRLGNIIEASTAADTAAARASRNRGISLTDTIAGAAGMSSAGVPGAAAMAMANKLGRTRGPATVSWAADRLGKAVAPLAQSSVNPATAQGAEGATLAQLVEWLRSRYGVGGPVPAIAEEEGPSR